MEMEWERLVEKAKSLAHEAAAEGGSFAAARAFLRTIREALMKERPPDGWTIGGAPFVGVPRFVAFVYLPEPVPDPWGRDTDIDAVAVESAVLGIVDAAAGEVIVGDPQEFARKWGDRPLKFCVADRATHLRAEEILRKYLLLDREDLRGACLIQAFVPLGIRGDTGDPEWDEWANSVLEREREEARRRHEEAERRFQEWRRREEEARRREREEERARHEQFVLEARNRIMRGAPVFIIDGQPYYWRGEDPWIIKVPSWAIPHLIGQRGRAVRLIKEVLGIRKIEFLGFDQKPRTRKPKVEILPEGTP